MAGSAATAVPRLELSTAVTDVDHGQVVALAAWLCFTAGVLLSVVRVYIQWPLNALVGKDDYAYAVSFGLTIVQTAVTVNAVRNGFGKTGYELDRRQAIDVAKVSMSTPPIQSLDGDCAQNERNVHNVHDLTTSGAVSQRATKIACDALTRAPNDSRRRPSMQPTFSSSSPSGAVRSSSPSSSPAWPRKPANRASAGSLRHSYLRLASSPS